MLQEDVYTPVVGEEKRYWFKKAIDHLKLEVSINRYLEANGILVRRGRARCAIHGGSNPEAFIILDSGRKFFCHSCQAKGDIIDLACALESHENTWTAVVSLAQNFGVELPSPTKSEGWTSWQKKKAVIRDSALEALARSYQRRYFRVFGGALLEGIGDQLEREEEGRKLFKDLEKTARIAATNRMARNG
ncbi:MAG: hypothetical protein H0T57_04915 [Rubrobacter sp.]|nr:hypothetical protein [Rubrobacter sp.]